MHPKRIGNVSHILPSHQIPSDLSYLFAWLSATCQESAPFEVRLEALHGSPSAARLILSSTLFPRLLLHWGVTPRSKPERYRFRSTDEVRWLGGSGSECHADPEPQTCLVMQQSLGGASCQHEATWHSSAQGNADAYNRHIG